MAVSTSSSATLTETNLKNRKRSGSVSSDVTEDNYSSSNDLSSQHSDDGRSDVSSEHSDDGGIWPASKRNRRRIVPGSAGNPLSDYSSAEGSENEDEILKKRRADRGGSNFGGQPSENDDNTPPSLTSEEEGWPKHISVSELQNKYGYSGKYTENQDENNRQNASFIYQLKGCGSKTPIELHRNGSVIVDYKSSKGAPAIKILNDHLDDARGFARYRNPSLTIARLENSDRSTEYHLIFSSPIHGISTKIVSKEVAEQIIKESEIEFEKSLEALARLKLIENKIELDYTNDANDRYFLRILNNAQNSLDSESVEAWTNWKKSERAFAIFESEINNPTHNQGALLKKFQDAHLIGELVTEEDVLKSFLDLISEIKENPNLLNYDNSDLSELGRKKCSDILSDLFPSRSESIEKLNSYILSDSKGIDYSEPAIKKAIKEITPEEINGLRRRASYKEVDEDLKCADLGYSEREKKIIKSSNIYYKDVDLRGNKKERFDHFLDNIDGWTGRYDGLSHRRSEKDENIATVNFKGMKNGDGPYDGSKILYVEMRGTEPGTKYYVKVELATANKDYWIHNCGKPELKKRKTGDLIFDEKTVYYIDENGNHQPKPVSELSDHNKKRYEALSISAISMIDGERKTAVLFEGRTTPCVSLAKSEKAIDEKATDSENRFDSILPLSEKFDIVVKMNRGENGKWYPDKKEPKMYLRNIHDKDADLKEVPIGHKASFFGKAIGSDKELLDFLQKNGVAKENLEALIRESGSSESKDKAESHDVCKHLEKHFEKKVRPNPIFTPGREARKLGARQSQDDIGIV